MRRVLRSSLAGGPPLPEVGRLCAILVLVACGCKRSANAAASATSAAGLASAVAAVGEFAARPTAPPAAMARAELLRFAASESRKLDTQLAQQLAVFPLAGGKDDIPAALPCARPTSGEQSALTAMVAAWVHLRRPEARVPTGSDESGNERAALRVRFGCVEPGYTVVHVAWRATGANYGGEAIEADQAVLNVQPRQVTLLAETSGTSTEYAAEYANIRTLTPYLLAPEPGTPREVVLLLRTREVGADIEFAQIFSARAPKLGLREIWRSSNAAAEPLHFFPGAGGFGIQITADRLSGADAHRTSDVLAHLGANGEVHFGATLNPAAADVVRTIEQTRAQLATIAAADGEGAAADSERGGRFAKVRAALYAVAAKPEDVLSWLGPVSRHEAWATWDRVAQDARRLERRARNSQYQDIRAAAGLTALPNLGACTAGTAARIDEWRHSITRELERHEGARTATRCTSDTAQPCAYVVTDLTVDVPCDHPNGTFAHARWHEGGDYLRGAPLPIRRTAVYWQKPGAGVTQLVSSYATGTPLPDDESELRAVLTDIDGDGTPDAAVTRTTSAPDAHNTTALYTFLSTSLIPTPAPVGGRAFAFAQLLVSGAGPLVWASRADEPGAQKDDRDAALGGDGAAPDALAAYDGEPRAFYTFNSTGHLVAHLPPAPDGAPRDAAHEAQARKLVQATTFEREAFLRGDPATLGRVGEALEQLHVAPNIQFDIVGKRPGFAP